MICQVYSFLHRTLTVSFGQRPDENVCAVRGLFIAGRKLEKTPSMNDLKPLIGSQTTTTRKKDEFLGVGCAWTRRSPKPLVILRVFCNEQDRTDMIGNPLSHVQFPGQICLL